MVVLGIETTCDETAAAVVEQLNQRRSSERNLANKSSVLFAYERSSEEGSSMLTKYLIATAISAVLCLMGTSVNAQQYGYFDASMMTGNGLVPVMSASQGYGVVAGAGPSLGYFSSQSTMRWQYPAWRSRLVPIRPFPRPFPITPPREIELHARVASSSFMGNSQLAFSGAVAAPRVVMMSTGRSR